MSIRGLPGAIGLLAALALACGSGCSKERPEPVPCVEADAGTPVDPLLLSFLSRARSAHHLADGREQAKDLRGAVAALEALTAGPAPASEGRPEVREVLADTHGRLADLLSRLGETEQAFQTLASGLALVPERNYFRGHLYEVQGLLEERRAEELRKKGDEASASAARERALSAFEESMRIQGEVIDQAAPR